MQVTADRMLVIVGKQTVELSETREQLARAVAEVREVREQLAAAQAANMGLVDRIRVLSQGECDHWEADDDCRGDCGPVSPDVDADIARAAMGT